MILRGGAVILAETGREMLDTELAGFAQNDSAFHRVAEFADVAGPGVGVEGGFGGGGKTGEDVAA